MKYSKSNCSDRQSWSTPKALFDQLHSEYQFTVDACAESWNAKLDRYWSPQDDGLAQSWDNKRIWCNPPYNSIGPWVEKAFWAKDCFSALLLPVRTDQEWFHKFCTGILKFWFVGRIQFEPPPGCEKSSNTEPSMLVVNCGNRVHLADELSRDAKTGRVVSVPTGDEQLDLWRLVCTTEDLNEYQG